MKVTIKDVAKAAGGSIGTVDRVLNNRPHVKAATRLRVIAEIKRLGYVPNRHASLLASGALQKIGLICFSYPGFFWDQLVIGAKTAAEEMAVAGIELIVKRIPTDLSAEKYLAVVEDLQKEGISILLTVGVDYPAVIEYFAAARLPVAFINVDIARYKEKLFYIGPDEERFGQIAGGLIGKLLGGRGRLLVISLKSDSFYLENSRLAAFLQIIQERYPAISLVQTIELAKQDLAADLSAFTREVFNLQPDAIYLVDGSFMLIVDSLVKEQSKGKAARPIIVGHEISSESTRLLKEDLLDIVLHQNPYAQGYAAIKKPCSILINREVLKNSFLAADLVILTREMLLEPTVGYHDRLPPFTQGLPLN